MSPPDPPRSPAVPTGASAGHERWNFDEEPSASNASERTPVQTAPSNATLKGRIRNLRKGNNKVFLEVAGLYIVILALLALAWLLSGIRPSSLVLAAYIGVFVGVAWCQFSLTHALHEAVHYNFGAPHRELLGALLTAYPIGLTMAYRHVHWTHHKYFGNKDLDLEYEPYSDFPRSKLRLLGRLLYFGSGWVALKQFLFQRVPRTRDNELRERACLAATQVVICSLFTLTLGFWAYVVLWILPVMTLGKCYSTTRAFCEHSSPTGVPVYRTITGNFFQTTVLGMFKFNYHAEHHAYPSIPYTNLTSMHTMFFGSDAKGRFGREHYARGYLNLLIDWFRDLPLVEIRRHAG